MVSRRRVQRLVVAAMAVVACGTLVSACGSSSSSGGAGKPTTLKVGVIPIADVAPLYLGVQKGFFKAQKLTIQPQLAAGGAAIVPAVLSGSDQIGFSNTISLIIASSKGLPIQIISQGVLGGSSPKQAWDAVLVKKGSSVRTPWMRSSRGSSSGARPAGGRRPGS